MKDCIRSKTDEAEKKAQILEELEKTCISIPSSQPADPQNDGRVVYISGLITTDERLHDETFDLKDIHAVKFGRIVEMYQWRAYNTGTKESPDLKYRKVWSSDAIEPHEFDFSGNHVNPPFKISNKHLEAKNVMIGKLPISGELLSLAPVTPYEFATRYRNPMIAERIFLKGEEPENPEIGDHRVSFYILRSHVGVSAITRQENGILSGNSLSAECDLEPSIMHPMCQKDMWKNLREKYKVNKSLLSGIKESLGYILIFAIVWFVLILIVDAGKSTS